MNREQKEWDDRTKCDNQEKAIQLVAKRLANLTRRSMDYEIYAEEYKMLLGEVGDFAQRFDIPFSANAHVAMTDALMDTPPDRWVGSTADC